MTAKTKIEWTDHTFNIAWGCIKVSPGCEHCYAETFSKRTGHGVWGPAKTTPRRTFGEKHWSEPLKWEREAANDPSGGAFPTLPGRLVFCSSMCDVFEDHPTIDAERERLWPLIRATPHLTWQILTKRPERIATHLPSDWGSGYPNVWLGTSVESQLYAGRARVLREIPARIRFLSVEPMLGPVSVRDSLWPVHPRWPAPYRSAEAAIAAGAIIEYSPQALISARWADSLIQWIIIGGESGPGARPLDVAWVRALVLECQRSKTAVFVKQLGAKPGFRLEDEEARGNVAPSFHHYDADAQLHIKKLDDAKGGGMAQWPDDLRIREFPAVHA
jgi:protein gp37